jgi:hypothetical protein
MVSSIIGGLATLGMAMLLIRRFLRARRTRTKAPERLLGPAKALLEDPQFEDKGGVDYPQLVGRYRGHFVQVRPVVDTLAVRKLPVLWVLVTIPEPLPVRAIFDLMMRPAGPTTFSNFDHLPVTLDRLPDFPETGVVRTDDPEHVLPAHVVAPHLGVFHDRRAKELLIAPKGVRLVWQLAEADRTQYGIFRQAEFGDPVLDSEVLQGIIDRLVSIREAIIAWKGKP